MTDPTFDQPTQARPDEPTQTLRRERPTQSLDLTSAPSDGSTTAFLDAVAAGQGEPSGTDPGSGDQGADDENADDENDGDENDSDENDSDLFGDEQWDRPPRTNRLTRVLLMAILVVAGFGGGVLVQKHAGSSSGSASSLPSGFPTGGFSPGAGGFGGPAAGGGTSTAAAGSGASSSQAPVVVGTVKSVSGTTVLVANFAGTVVKVTVPATATVTTPGLTPLAVGETVSVSGAKKADGSVVATAIVARAAG
jgi:hypothetical protein